MDPFLGITNGDASRLIRLLFFVAREFEALKDNWEALGWFWVLRENRWDGQNLNFAGASDADR